MSDDRYCERCYNTGELDCYCGGDFCICERGGTYECPDCSRQNGFSCEEIEDEEPALKTEDKSDSTLTSGQGK